jgi:hypothetical protein
VGARRASPLCRPPTPAEGGGNRDCRAPPSPLRLPPSPGRPPLRECTGGERRGVSCISGLALSVSCVSGSDVCAGATGATGDIGILLCDKFSKVSTGLHGHVGMDFLLLVGLEDACRNLCSCSRCRCLRAAQNSRKCLQCSA